MSSLDEWIQMLPKLQVELEEIDSRLRMGFHGQERKRLLERKEVLLGELAIAKHAAELRAQQQAATSPSAIGPFVASEDYRSVRLSGRVFSLTTRQAQIIQILHEAYLRGTPELSEANILERLGTERSRLRDSFKNHREEYKALVSPGRTKGSFRLNL